MNSVFFYGEKMTVYIEQVFVSNFFIDFFIVLLTVDILKCKTKKIRVFLTSVIGAAVSCLVPVIPSFVVPLKAACLIVLPFLMKKQKYAKDYFLTVSVFTAITLVFGGAAYLIKCSVRYDIYLKLICGVVPILFSLSGIIVLFIVGELKKNLLTERRNNEKEKEVVITDESGASYGGIGFWDSGNRIYANNGEPVTVVSERIYNMFCGAEEKIPVRTVSGITDLKAKEADLLIYSDSGNNMIYKTKIASAPFWVGKEEIILHADMLEDK